MMNYKSRYIASVFRCLSHKCDSQLLLVQNVVCFVVYNGNMLLKEKKSEFFQDIKVSC